MVSDPLVAAISCGTTIMSNPTAADPLESPSQTTTSLLSCTSDLFRPPSQTEQELKELLEEQYQQALARWELPRDSAPRDSQPPPTRFRVPNLLDKRPLRRTKSDPQLPRLPTVAVTREKVVPGDALTNRPARKRKAQEMEYRTRYSEFPLPPRLLDALDWGWLKGFPPQR